MNEVEQDNQPGKKNYRTFRKSTAKRVELPCCEPCKKKKKNSQVVVSCETLFQKLESSFTFWNKTCTSVADPGKRALRGPPIPILRSKWGPKGRKNIFLSLPHLSQGLDDDRVPPLSQGLDDDRVPTLSQGLDDDRAPPFSEGLDLTLYMLHV